MKPLLILTLLATSAGASAMSAGEYVAKAGDCSACHTSPEGQALAGGMRFATPLGDIYATNITPDKNTALAATALMILTKRCVRAWQKMVIIFTPPCRTPLMPK